MDNRLKRIRGRKSPSGLLDTDLPQLARAITALVRGHGHFSLDRRQGASYIVITGLGFRAVVLASEWNKITPLFNDGTFNPLLHPVEAGERNEFDTTIRFSPSTLPSKDPLYKRVLFHLGVLFPDQVPTGS